MKEMNTKDAITYLLKEHNLSKYAFAKSIGVAPPYITNWLNHTCMSDYYAQKVEEMYGIRILDQRNPGRS